MGTVKDFENLEIWRMSRVLVNSVYSDFKNCRDYGFRDQITRAWVSIMNNISEGFCRNSDAEFRHFLNISKGSAGEVKSMYYIAEDQNYLDNAISVERRNKTQQLINSISALMKYLSTTT
jgi:four helix bundle protein